MAIEIVQDPVDRQLLEMALGGWPIAAPANVLWERLAALRKAFHDTMTDPGRRAVGLFRPGQAETENSRPCHWARSRHRPGRRGKKRNDLVLLRRRRADRRRMRQSLARFHGRPPHARRGRSGPRRGRRKTQLRAQGVHGIGYQRHRLNGSGFAHERAQKQRRQCFIRTFACLSALNMVLR